VYKEPPSDGYDPRSRLELRWMKFLEQALILPYAYEPEIDRFRYRIHDLLLLGLLATLAEIKPTADRDETIDGALKEIQRIGFDDPQDIVAKWANPFILLAVHPLAVQWRSPLRRDNMTWRKWAGPGVLISGSSQKPWVERIHSDERYDWGGFIPVSWRLCNHPLCGGALRLRLAEHHGFLMPCGHPDFDFPTVEEQRITDLIVNTYWVKATEQSRWWPSK
jgi:hypothetical protein